MLSIDQLKSITGGDSGEARVRIGQIEANL
jgi:hypothetical protein